MGKSSEEVDPDIIELDLEQFREQNNPAGPSSTGNSQIIPDPFSFIEGMLGISPFRNSSRERILSRNTGEIANFPFGFLSALPTTITMVIQESNSDMVSEDEIPGSIFEQLRGLGLDFRER